MVALMVVLTIITFLTIDYWVQHAEHKRALATEPRGAPAPAAARPAPRILFGLPIDRVPAHAFLDRGHTWAKIEPGGTLRIGSDGWAPALLGAPESVVLPTPGSKVKQGEVFATLRRQDREIQLQAPVSGVIESVNPQLASDPLAIARDPFTLGWLIQIRPEALGAGLRSLLIGDEVGSWMRTELGRLRERLAALAPDPLGVPAATMLDGGLPAEGVAAKLTPDQWGEIVQAFFAPLGGPVTW
jgi:glycine cleavage system H protein